MNYDIYMVGVGGQGVLTIGHLIMDAALHLQTPSSFYPTKGMAQRGGFVKVELRLGADGVGPRIGERSADIVASMERSEALRAIPFAKPGGHFLLYDHVWEPTGVQLGLDEYPSLEDVAAAIKASGAHLTLLRPSDRPVVDGTPAAPNVFLLGALLAHPPLSQLFDEAEVERVLEARWPKHSDANLVVFRAGLAGRHTDSEPPW